MCIDFSPSLCGKNYSICQMISKRRIFFTTCTMYHIYIQDLVVLRGLLCLNGKFMFFVTKKRKKWSAKLWSWRQTIGDKKQWRLSYRFQRKSCTNMCQMQLLGYLPQPGRPGRPARSVSDGSTYVILWSCWHLARESVYLFWRLENDFCDLASLLTSCFLAFTGLWNFLMKFWQEQHLGLLH